MPFNPKEESFLHALPGRAPAAPLAPIPHPHAAPHVMPMPGQKHSGPAPGRWDKLQQYLQQPAAAPVAPVNPNEPEIP